MLIGISLVAGLIVGAAVLPMAGIAGVAARDAAKTFDALPVPALGQLPQRSEILDRKGHLIAYIYPSGGGQQNNPIDRVPVTYNQIAPVMRRAIVAIEDSRFWQHGAFDPRGTGRALVSDLEHNAVQGGSTLAQQYVKNALILTATNQRQVQDATAPDTVRKLRELRMAAIVEHQLTRPQLLAAYLSAAYYENGAYGIQVAALRYFSTTAKHLTLDQSAMLAGLVENPFAYNPVAFPKSALQRRNEVLKRMRQLGYITLARAQAAQAKPLGLHMRNSTLQSGCISASARNEPFFCDYVMAAMKGDPAYAQAYAALNRIGGIRIYTTLDRKDQRAAQNAVNFVEPAHSAIYNPGHNADAEVLIQPGTGRQRARADHGRLRGRSQVRRRRRRADRVVIEDLHPADRAQAGPSVRLQPEVRVAEHADRLHRLQGPANQPVPGEQRRGTGQGHRHAVQRHHAVDQRLLLRTGEPGRPVQRGQDRGQPRAAPRGRHLAASPGSASAARQQPVRRQLPVLHAGLDLRLADEHGRGLRHRPGPRGLLPAGRDQQDHYQCGQASPGEVRQLPPGTDARGRRRR